jgi:hypothetical protein
MDEKLHAPKGGAWKVHAGQNLQNRIESAILLASSRGSMEWVVAMGDRVARVEACLIEFQRRGCQNVDCPHDSLETKVNKLCDKMMKGRLIFSEGQFNLKERKERLSLFLTGFRIKNVA